MAEENEGEGEGMSEDFGEDDNAAVLTITCRFSSAVPLGRTECSDRALELSELQVEQLPYYYSVWDSAYASGEYHQSWLCHGL